MKAMKQLMKHSGVLIMVLLFAIAPAFGQAANEPQSTVDEAVASLPGFTSNPDFQKHIKDAKGIFIVPSLMKADGGSGVLLSRIADTRKWTYPAFYSMDSDVSSLPAGVDSAELVLLIMTDRAMSAMLNGKFQPGSAKSADIQYFSRSKGEFVSLKLENAVIAVLNEWNKKYYGRGVLTADILIKNKVQVAGADRLRKLLASTLSR